MYLIFDTETTGLPKNYKAPLTDFDNWPRLVQLAWQLHSPTGELLAAKNMMIKPEGFTIPHNAEKVHGISTERAMKEGIAITEALNIFSEDIARAELGVAHNVEFDNNIIGAEYLRAGLENGLVKIQSLDTKLVSTNFCAIPGRFGKYKWPTLTELYQKLFGQPFADAHDAAYDVDAAARCFFGLIKESVVAPRCGLAIADIRYQSPFEVAESKVEYRTVKELLAQALEELKERKGNTGGLKGIPSGFTKLDRLTSGWQPSNLVVIGARPGMGKTAFVVSALRNAAVNYGHAVAMFSLDMPSTQLVNRMIAGEAELESQKIQNGNLTEEEWTQLVHKTANLAKAPIFIEDTQALSTLELAERCRHLKEQHDIRLVVVDCLQLMTADLSASGGAAANREQEIAAITRSLKSLAKELNIPVIAISQVSRAVENRGGEKRPQLSDLRESGTIEQEADVVMFLYRSECYGFTHDANGMPVNGTGELIIAKHRNGPLANVPLKFIGKFTKFTDPDEREPAGANAEDAPF